ncbi:MAG TPA: hypothetical protein VF698_19115 [Thermoanaerobaculia bacterium]
MKATFAAALAACLVTTSLHAQLDDIPNAIKYRDTSKPAAKGRSGSAAIEARALLARNGTTDLVVTTGSLDADAPAPGNIDKVQVKLAAADVTRNFNNLSSGGLFAQSFTGLGAGEPLQIQTNVSGIDPNRTDVATVSETVKLRPDLAIDALHVAPHTAAGVPLRVNALISERNGDLGARTNCVLLAGGVEVDRANNLWVDAHGTVSCQFVYAFESTGLQELQVALTGVNPGDYDTSNNSASATIRVFATATEMPQWWASGEERNWTSTTKARSYFQEMDSSDHGWSKTTSFSANIADFRGSFADVKVSYEESHDGTVVADIADAPLDSGFQRCRAAVVDGTFVEKCLIPPGRRGPTVPILQIHVNRGGGQATYRSHGWYLSYDYYADRYDRYTVNSESTSTWGEGSIELGNAIAMTVRASDGTNFFEATPFINMAPNDMDVVTPYGCTTDWTGNQNCWGYEYHSVGRWGADSHNM